LRVALVDPLNPCVPEDLRFALGKDIDVVVAALEQVEERIRQYYGTETASMEEILQQLGDARELVPARETGGATAVEAEANTAPIIRLVDLILYQAIQDRASDREIFGLVAQVVGRRSIPTIYPKRKGTASPSRPF